MRISIVVYDITTANRIKKNTYKYFSINTKRDINIIWLKDMYIEFKERLIIINWHKSAENILRRYMDTVLIGEEITINSMDNMWYYESYEKAPLSLV